MCDRYSYLRSVKIFIYGISSIRLRDRFSSLMFCNHSEGCIEGITLSCRISCSMLVSCLSGYMEVIELLPIGYQKHLLRFRFLILWGSSRVEVRLMLETSRIKVIKLYRFYMPLIRLMSVLPKDRYSMDFRLSKFSTL